MPTTSSRENDLRAGDKSAKWADYRRWQFYQHLELGSFQKITEREFCNQRADMVSKMIVGPLGNLDEGANFLPCFARSGYAAVLGTAANWLAQEVGTTIRTKPVSGDFCSARSHNSSGNTQAFGRNGYRRRKPCRHRPRPDQKWDGSRARAVAGEHPSGENRDSPRPPTEANRQA